VERKFIFRGFVAPDLRHPELGSGSIVPLLPERSSTRNGSVARLSGSAQEEKWILKRVQDDDCG
jgi:hypothetical protein